MTQEPRFLPYRPKCGLSRTATVQAEASTAAVVVVDEANVVEDAALLVTANRPPCHAPTVEKWSAVVALRVRTRMLNIS